MRFCSRMALSAILLLGLGACSTLDSVNPFSSSEPSKTVAATTGCPQVAIIRDLSVYQNPPAADDLNLVISARMGKVRGGCTIDAKGSAIEGGFDVVAVKGSNTAGRRAAIPFFISVLDANEQVVRKETYEIPIFFEGTSTQQSMNVPVNPTIAIPDGADASTYRVFIGFQLSREQVEANHNFFEQNPSAR